MWILTPSITSAFAAATGASTSASSEQLASACAQSLLWRSSASPPATWQRRLKQNSWTTHLSGAICEPSLGESFTDWWTSFLAAIRASHSAPPANASAPKTQDTSGRTYQPELLQCDQVPVSLKTSRDISALGFPTCCKTWQEWVTERRGAFSQRLKLARRTSVSGSLSWPTASARDHKDCSDPATWKCKEKRNRYDQLGRAVFSDAANWPTATATNRVRNEETMAKCAAFRKRNANQNTVPLYLEEVVLRQEQHGQAAPASSSSLTSRQGLWPTPEGMAGGKTSRGGNRKDELLLSGMVKQWATPQAHDAQGPKTPEQIAAMRAKGHGVKNLNEMVTWPTPSASCDQGGPSGLAGGSGNRKKLNSMLPEAEAKAMGCGKLNPRWVETLMGLPIGWTMPSCTSPQTIAPMSCDSSAMELCQPPQSEPSEFSLAS